MKDEQQRPGDGLVHHTVTGRKIGLLGGTFDPIHTTHLHMAEVVREQCRLDEVWFIPVNIPPHKQVPQHVQGQDRVEMVRLAIENIPYFRLSLIEFERKGISYTVDTLRALHEQYPDDQFRFIIGADMVEQLPEWEGIDELVQLVKFIGVGRPENNLHAQHSYDQYVQYVDMVPSHISSTLLRERRAQGKSIRFLVPDSVYEYIDQHNLYTHHQHLEIDLLNRRKDDLLCIRQALTPERYVHTLNVVRLSRELAEQYGADVYQAETAALFHDWAKYWPEEEMARLIQTVEVLPSDLLQYNKELWHAFVGAWVVQQEAKVTDAQVVDAIRYHTTGRADMTLLEKIICLADYIEPGRQFPGVDQVRQLATIDLDQALLHMFSQTIVFLEEKGRQVYPLTRQAYEYLKEEQDG